MRQSWAYIRNPSQIQAQPWCNLPSKSKINMYKTPKSTHNTMENTQEVDNMVLTSKEITALEDLRTQEQSCIDKYTKYEKEAKDTVLKNLFSQLAKEEQKHYDTLSQMIDGNIPKCDCNDSKGANYNPKATYACCADSEDKKHDCFLATDCIGTEKLVSCEYNTDVFIFGEPSIRKVLADIQIEEQNHAEMLWKYKEVNCMQ